MQAIIPADFLWALSSPEAFYLSKTIENTSIRCTMNMIGDQILQALISVLVILFILLAGPYIVGSLQERAYTSSLMSDLTYTVTISTNASLTHISLFIPIPSDGKGRSPIIDQVGMEDNSRVFQGWNTSIYGANSETYLKLWTDYLPGPFEGTERIDYTLLVAAPVDSALHTREPERYDFVLFPDENLTEIPCNEEDSGVRCFEYETRMYAAYRVPSQASVKIQVNLIGGNRWHIFQEYQNRYTDTMVALFTGPTSGWYEVRGELHTSLGDDNPFWREKMEEKRDVRLKYGVNTSMMRWHTITPLP